MFESLGTVLYTYMPVVLKKCVFIVWFCFYIMSQFFFILLSSLLMCPALPGQPVMKRALTPEKVIQLTYFHLNIVG